MSQGSKSFRDLAIDGIKALPPFPIVFYKILDISENVHGSRAELLRALSLDQAIAAKVLQVANSAYYGLKKKVETIDRAVALIGENAVREIVIFCATNGLMNRPLGRYHLAARQFWEHSVMTSLAARCIATRKIPHVREKALVAGLLHDIGKLVLNDLIHLREADEIQRRLEKGFQVDKIERDLFGIDHAEVGCLFAEQWSFPDEIREAIAFHHKPQKAEENPYLVYLVFVSDKYSHLLSSGVKIGDYIVSQAKNREWNAAMGALDLSAEDSESIFAELHAELKDTESFLGL